MKRSGFHVSAMLCALALAACGDDSAAGGGGVSTASCDAQCDAQDGVQGDCTPFVDNATCKQLCKALADSLPKSCSDEFDAYYQCSASDGFECKVGLVSQKTTACDDEQTALDACDEGGSAGMGGGKDKCEGARDDGFCPQVACPCPEGTKMTSGFDSEAGGCTCWDENTCKDLTCD